MTGERPKPPPIPRAPSDLGTTGRALWRRILKTYSLSPAELETLERACHQAEDIALLEAAIAEGGLYTTGSQGQQRLRQEVAEVRLGRQALAKLMGQLNLPSGKPGQASASKSGKQTARSNRAQKAANARWAGRNVVSLENRKHSG